MTWKSESCRWWEPTKSELEKWHNHIINSNSQKNEWITLLIIVF